jgi:ADP-ribosylation factor protein 1
MSAEGLIDQLELKTLEDTPWKLQQTCAISGDGLIEGFSWLAEVLKNPQNFHAANAR